MEIALGMHIDGVARRKQIADEMASVPVGQRRGIIDDAALKYGVCSGTVWAACKEHHVTIGPLRRLT